MLIRDAAQAASGDEAIVAQLLLLTGPEVVEVVRDIILIVFLVFAFFALVLFVVVTLLLYRRVAGLLEALTTAVEHGDRVLEEIGSITETFKRGGALPGMAFRGALGTLGAILGGVLKRRRGRDDNSD
ncbi:MAG: hypothetical protein IIC92_03460 [Chloroflexi bacterium]|nr:hypothetical protein [Chloroflexota bacterium]